MKIAIVNGPNINLLGKREKTIYGNISFDDYYKVIQKEFPKIHFKYFQSNIEGEIIDFLQKVGYSFDGVVLNAAAYTHTSVGIADTVKAIDTPVVEVHISNVWTRESFRQHSFLSPYVKGVIVGFGLQSYQLAIKSFLKRT